MTVSSAARTISVMFMTPEFALIQQHFTRPTKRAILGVGDDCALLRVAANQELAISTDTLVAGRHFFPDADPEKLGHKALAVNLSDLAAMGATPRYVTLALTLPRVDHNWLAAFAQGFFALADQHNVELIGGDTTSGSLSMTLTVFGEIEAGRALRRDLAIAGDDVWVSGTLGGAALALMVMQDKLQVPANVFSVAASHLHTPVPPIALGLALLGVAHAAIDLSDGLVADLTHICERSNLAAHIMRAQVPVMPGIPANVSDACVLAGGDDYELCFTAPVSARNAVEAAGSASGTNVTRIGTMIASEAATVTVLDENGRNVTPTKIGFDHFS